DHAGVQVLRVQPDNSLRPTAAWSAAEHARQRWVPCCVVEPAGPHAQPDGGTASVGEGGQGRRTGVAGAVRGYLAGPWHALDMVPTGWAHGGRLLTDYTVRAAAHRMLQLLHLEKDPSGAYAVGAGVRPCLWAPDVSG